MRVNYRWDDASYAAHEVETLPPVGAWVLLDDTGTHPVIGHSFDYRGRHGLPPIVTVVLGRGSKMLAEKQQPGVTVTEGLLNSWREK